MSRRGATSYVLMDIEGTTTPVTFVHTVLFPYARARLAGFTRDHGGEPAVRACLAETQRTVAAETGVDLSSDQAVAQLEAWTTEDRKHPALKALQGMIWEAGYREGAFKAEVYAEVPACLAAWKQRGLTLGIYSSGSVQAQKLLFRHTNAGDLTPLLSDYFDTAVGGKLERASYRTILERLDRPAEVVLFLSDTTLELDAAAACGMRTVQLVRPGTRPGDTHPVTTDFGAVDALLATWR